jgi:hypothetical protein
MPRGPFWHPGEIKPVMDADELRDALWNIYQAAERAGDPRRSPRPADWPDAFLVINAATAVRELVDDWAMARDGSDAL